MSSRLPVLVFALTVACAVLLSQVSARTYFRLPRSTRDNEANGEVKRCHSNSPCGWAIYTPVSRDVIDYMPNKCICPDDQKCDLTEDDISVSAYVHRCRSKDNQQSTVSS